MKAYISANWEKRTKLLYKDIKPRLKKKQQVLIVAPEKWLAEKVYNFFEKKEKKHIVLVTGELSSKRYREIWELVRTGEIRLIIGTQKALFLPFSALSVIVLEEESFSTHTLWDQYPRLSNWYGVKKLASIFSAELAYTATLPSVHLAYEIEQKKTETALFEPLQPHLSLLSFSAENKKQRAILPTEFLMKLKVWVKKKEKVVIFYNRRGIKSEKVQEVLKKFLPRSTELASITADTEIVRPANVIVGTSALFPYLAELKADHVVWLFPEVNLLYPDFRSRERAMFTLSRLQLSLTKGKAVEIVTRHPYLIKERLDIDLTTYFSEELKERKKLSFPPYTDMVRLRFKAKTKKAAYQQAVLIREQLLSRHGHSTETFIIRGPFGIDEVYVLLLGRLSYLKKLYDSLPINSLDLDPHHIF